MAYIKFRKNLMARDIFEIIIEILFYVLLVWLIIQILLKLFGNSPTIEMILTTGLGLIFAYLLKVSKFIGKTEEFMENSKESFMRISRDMEEIKKKLKI